MDMCCGIWWRRQGTSALIVSRRVSFARPGDSLAQRAYRPYRLHQIRALPHKLEIVLRVVLPVGVATANSPLGRPLFRPSLA
jgi:hypothetical protein